MIDKITSSPAQTTKPLSDSPANVRNLIVVGFSTMHSSQTAVTWAATEAERRMAGLHIVHAYPLPQLGQPVQHDVDDLLRNEACTLLDRIADSTRRDHPQLEITTRLIQGAPVNALRDESAAAALTVVGAKGIRTPDPSISGIGRVSGRRRAPGTRRRRTPRSPHEPSRPGRRRDR